MASSAGVDRNDNEGEQQEFGLGLEIGWRITMVVVLGFGQLFRAN